MRSLPLQTEEVFSKTAPMIDLNFKNPKIAQFRMESVDSC